MVIKIGSGFRAFLRREHTFPAFNVRQSRVTPHSRRSFKNYKLPCPTKVKGLSKRGASPHRQHPCYGRYVEGSFFSNLPFNRVCRALARFYLPPGSSPRSWISPIAAHTASPIKPLSLWAPHASRSPGLCVPLLTSAPPASRHFLTEISYVQPKTHT